MKCTSAGCLFKPVLWRSGSSVLHGLGSTVIVQCDGLHSCGAEEAWLVCTCCLFAAFKHLLDLTCTIWFGFVTTDDFLLLKGRDSFHCHQQNSALSFLMSYL